MKQIRIEKKKREGIAEFEKKNLNLFLVLKGTSDSSFRGGGGGMLCNGH